MVVQTWEKFSCLDSKRADEGARAPLTEGAVLVVRARSPWGWRGRGTRDSCSQRCRGVLTPQQVQLCHLGRDAL